MRVLVIGSRGFTGRHLVERLRAGGTWDVVEGTATEIDLTQPATIRRALDATSPDAVINLGALSHVATSNIRGLFEVNAFGLYNLMTALKETGFLGRLIFASSANIYGDRTSDLITEDRCPNPVNHYSFSKVLAENFCKLFQDRFRIVITRPFSCIGVGQAATFLVPKIVKHFHERRPIIELGNIDVERDFIDIRDVAAAYELLLNAKDSPDILHIATGQTHSIRDIISICAELTGHPIEIRVNPAFIRPNDLLYQRGDISRLAELGFVHRFALRETLEWMLNSCYTSTDQ